jgi:putative hydroxymethylpyrimidine transport system substrate-binding protein
VIGAFRNFELTQMRLAGGEGLAFFPEEHGVPPYEELVLVTNAALLGDPRLPRFLEAVEEATIFLTNHPDEAWRLFLKANPGLDDELNRKAWSDTLPRFAKRPAAYDAGRYERFAAFLAEAGLIDEALPAARYGVALR